MGAQLSITCALVSLSHTLVLRLSHILLRALRVKIMRTDADGSYVHDRINCKTTQQNGLEHRGGLSSNSLPPLLEQHHCQHDGDVDRIEGDMDPKLWSELPLHLLERVLSFLPPTSFLQQRSVCKDWNHYLSSSTFRNMYSKISGECPWFLMFRTGLCNCLSVYDPSMDRWHKIPLTFLPKPVHCAAASGGLLICRDNSGLLNLCVCNPITKEWKRLPPTIKKRVDPIVGVVVHRPSNSYEVTVFGEDLLSDGFNVLDITTEVYDSSTGLWRLAGAIPETTDLDFGCTYCRGSFYFISYCPYVVLCYNAQEMVWSRIHAPIPRFLSTPSLVECEGTLYMVGGIENKSHTIDSIQIWKLKENPAIWQKVVKMPSNVLKDFFKTPLNTTRYFSSVGNGHLICMTTFESSEVLSYDMKSGLWRWLPSYHCECDHFHEKHLWGLKFEPRFDLSL